MSISRREFIKDAAAVSAFISLSGIPLSGTGRKKTVSAPPGDRIRVGVAGVNSRGRAIAGTLSKMPRCQVACICDCDLDALEKCRGWVEESGAPRPDGEQDYRKMLDRNDIDAVVIAMPDHWHATAAIMALHAGKHVYLEKPASYCPEENAMLLEAERKYGKVVQVGMQRRSYPVLRQAVQELREGVIGEVRHATSWYATNRTSIGVGRPVPVPSRLNWDFWQGPAPRGPLYKDNIVHYNWHWRWHWGTGEALNNGTHFVDLVRWMMNLNEYPSEVASVGGRYHFRNDDWETPDTQVLSFQFGEKASFTWEGRSCDPKRIDGASTGVTLYGENGMSLFLNGKNEYVIFDDKDQIIRKVESDMTFRDGDRFNPSEELDAMHFANWFDAIENGTPVNDPLCEACMSTQYTQYGNIAQRLGRSLKIDPASGAILNDPESRQYWSRTYDPLWTPKQYL